MVRNGEYSLLWYSADSFENSSALTEITAECDGNYKFSSYFAGEKSTCKIRIYVNNVLKDENTCKPVAYKKYLAMLLFSTEFHEVGFDEHINVTIHYGIDV